MIDFIYLNKIEVVFLYVKMTKSYFLYEKLV